jgi:formate hydrogenlyase subunit 3/multisubunit Na+/H+ antiporter MnhD subunit
MDGLVTQLPWAIILILLPLAAGMACFVAPRIAGALGLLSVVAVLLATLGLGLQLASAGVYRHSIGGWGAPLGIELYADGLSLLMLGITALVGIGVSLYAGAYFTREQAGRFWPVWLFLLAALNGLFLVDDVFNLYVCLELIGLSAVSLTALAGTTAALAGAMRYLLATLLGSLLYLLGVALLYHTFGTVDISLLAGRVTPLPALWAALGLMGAGLILKTALFPFHFWLPAAHGSAPAPVSAVLSALVVKGSFYILLRLWIELYAPAGGQSAGLLFGVLGSAAVLWGSIQALRQARLKLMVAYSTVAQIGYLFLAFPLGGAAGYAWQGALYLLVSHALAKSAMFLAAGNLLRFGGHERIAHLDRVVQRLPLTVGAFAMAGVSIMGLPPSGGFIGKWLLLQTALSQGQWMLALVMVLGSVLAAAYVFRVLGHAFTAAAVPHDPIAVPLRMEWAAVLLAAGSIVLGLLAVPLFTLAGIGGFAGMGASLP